MHVMICCVVCCTCALTYQEKTLDEMDEYVMLLETHRIKVVFLPCRTSRGFCSL
jgi:hypothetical protein